MELEKETKKSIKPDKFETLTFEYFFPKLLKTFKTFDVSLGRETFRLHMNLR